MNLFRSSVYLRLLIFPSLRAGDVTMQIQRVVSERGVAALGKRGLRDIAPFADTRETDVRNAALDAIFEVYVLLESDLHRLFKVCG